MRHRSRSRRGMKAASTSAKNRARTRPTAKASRTGIAGGAATSARIAVTRNPTTMLTLLGSWLLEDEVSPLKHPVFAPVSMITSMKISATVV